MLLKTILSQLMNLTKKMKKLVKLKKQLKNLATLILRKRIVQNNPLNMETPSSQNPADRNDIQNNKLINYLVS